MNKLIPRAVLTVSTVLPMAALAPPAFAQLVGDQPSQLTDLEAIVGRLLNVATSLAGIAIFVTLVVGAFTLLTAGADQEKAAKARAAFTAAALGGALLIFIWLLLRFLKEFTGVDVTTFCIIDTDPDTSGCQQ